VCVTIKSYIYIHLIYGALYPPFGSIWDDEQTWHSICWVSPSAQWTCRAHVELSMGSNMSLPAGCLLNPVLVANPGLAVRPYLLMKSHIFTGLGTHDWWNHNFCHLYSNFSWLTPQFLLVTSPFVPHGSQPWPPRFGFEIQAGKQKIWRFPKSMEYPQLHMCFTIKNKHWFFHLNHDSYFKCMYIYICICIICMYAMHISVHMNMFCPWKIMLFV
jgi:hypothetical protein